MSQTASQTSLGVTLLKIILPVCLIVLGVAGFWYYKSKAVKFQRKPAVKTAPLVDIMKVNPDRVTAQIRAMGTVITSYSIHYTKLYEVGFPLNGFGDPEHAHGTFQAPAQALQ